MSKRHRFIPAGLLVCLGLTLAGGTAAAQNQACRASCQGGGDVQVDLGQKCMCVNKGQDCFLVSIGKDGALMTTQGHGRLGKAQGDKYQTKAWSSEGWDNDAIDMGIPEDTKVGKWIHKTRECGPGGGNSTLGCVAVPCDKWKEVKAEMGKTLDVCGGGAPMSASQSRPDPTTGPTDGVQTDFSGGQQ